MTTHPTSLSRPALWLAAAALLAACTAAGPATEAGGGVAGPTKLILAAYTTPREAYGQLLPLFAVQWKEQTGQEVTFEESYQGSGAQSRAIVEGFEADIAALSLQADIDRIAAAGLLDPEWQTAAPNRGMVSTSIVVFAVRPGNPKNIHDWADLAQPGLELLTPNPKTSGGAQWNVLALFGAALRGQVAGVPINDEAIASEFLTAVLHNVTVMDKGARESITNFEKGVGDVAITYENEVLVGWQAGQDYEMVIPRSTILIENPVAVVDAYVEKHGTRAAAEAFVAFLFTAPPQEVFAQHGLRATDPEVASVHVSEYPPVQDLFTIEYFGGWSTATPKYFGEDGIFTRASAAAQGQ